MGVIALGAQGRLLIVKVSFRETTFPTVQCFFICGSTDPATLTKNGKIGQKCLISAAFLFFLALDPWIRTMVSTLGSAWIRK